MNRPGRIGTKGLHLAAVVAVALLAVGVGYSIAETPPTYLESATVVFKLPKSKTSPNAYYIFAVPLITSGEAVAQTLMSDQAMRQIQGAGGTASVKLALVNLYDEEYPDYGVPLATLTATSPSPENVHRTFMIAERRIGHILAAQQAQLHVAPRNRISDQIIADTGPLPQDGSSKRVFAGLALLTVVAVSTLRGFLNRRGVARIRSVAMHLVMAE
jgi:hypothetical protein